MATENHDGLFLNQLDLASSAVLVSVGLYWLLFCRVAQKQKPTLADVVSILATIAMTAYTYTHLSWRVRIFLLQDSLWPSPTGLIYGLLSVVVGQIVTISYHYPRSEWGWFNAEKYRIQPKTAKDEQGNPIKTFKQELWGHVNRPESFLLLFSYLSLTWMLCLMPGSYYSMDGGVNWLHVLYQLLSVDFSMYLMHVTEHRIRPMYTVMHKPHHETTSPNLFSAFNGHLWDTLFMILLPLYTTALLVPANVWSYMAFGTSYSAYLMLIHSEFSHPWDTVVKYLGVGTAADHHVHHKVRYANFGHVFTYWDRVFGTYMSWKKMQKKLDGASKASIATNDGDKALKQGAYGKVKMHSSGTLKGALRNPRELLALLRFKLQGPPGEGQGSFLMPHFPKPCPQATIDDIDFAGGSLDKVSRSFAKVIRNLPAELSLPICIFYLALRALDTVEDDMDLSKFDPKIHKVPILVPKNDKIKVPTDPLQIKILSLRLFYTLLTPDKDADINVNLAGYAAGKVGEADEATLLHNFDRCVRVFNMLPPDHQKVVADITNQMGNGMADYINRDLREGTDDLKDYNMYCHIVAGQVGEGLSRQFSLCGLESKEVSERLMKDSFVGIGSLCSDMGLFLQKTNIIRDYLEDYVDARAFWPKTVWRKHVPKGSSLGYMGHAFAGKDIDEPFDEARQTAMCCLNEMITDSLSLMPRSIQYLRQLTDPSIFAFCAIPQLMALATLQTLYSNPKVFTGVLKIRKGIACRILMEVTDWAGLVSFVQSMVADLRKKVVKDAYAYPTKAKALKACDDILAELART